MSTLFLVLAVLFVLAVLALVAYTLFEVSPFGRHTDHYRDEDGRRRFESPRLD
jgi:hypothetical protein